MAFKRQHKKHQPKSLSNNSLQKSSEGMPVFFSALAEGRHVPLAPFKLKATGPAATATNFGGPVELRGRTDADFSNNRWSLVNEKGRAGKGCEGCSAKDCAQYSATVRSTFQVSTTVSLPNMADYAGYTKCQQQRIRDAINNQLAPHEQQHVAAFRTYNGTVDTPIAMTGCRSELENRVAARADEIHRGVEGPRRTAVQAKSDKLDPFVITPNLKCA